MVASRRVPARRACQPKGRPTVTPDGPPEAVRPDPVDATQGRPLHPGDVLAGRYRIEDLSGEVAGSQVWRAADDVLNRSVGVQVLSAADPRAPAFLDAARASTAVTDSRFLRVLDVADDEHGHAYVVREWARAVSLASLLQEDPMDNRRAAALVGEVAAAVEAAHEAGSNHRRLDPSTVFVKDGGAVRISGLGTDHALLGSAADVDGSGPGSGGLSAIGLAPRTPIDLVEAAEHEDVQALGRLLYACLVSRWPGGRDFGLPAAPTEHGRLLRPRQVRAGVSREADAVCDRILGQPPRHHQAPLRSARDVAQALALVGDDPTSLYDDQPSLVGGETDLFGTLYSFGSPADAPPPALLPDPRPTRRKPAQEPEPVSPIARSRAAARASTQGDRKWIWLAVILLLAVVSLVAYAVGRTTTNRLDTVEPSQTPSTSPRATSTPVERAMDRAIPVVGLTSFDPQGDGSEHPDDTAAAVDGDPQTAWKTLEYYGDPRLAGLKKGVGLLLDLGADQQLSSVLVRFGAQPTSYAVWAAPAGTTDPPASLTGLEKLGGQQGAGTDASVNLSDPVTTRYVVLWLTSLPAQSEGTYVGVVDEVSLRGQPS